MSSKDSRPSPSQSATLYAVGTKKPGNDKNIWIVTQSVNGVKRWKLYKKPTKIGSKTSKQTNKKTSSKTGTRRKRGSKKTKEGTSSFKEVFFGFKPVKQNNWTKWLENSSTNVKKTIEKLVSLKPTIEKMGIHMEFIAFPPDSEGNYWMDYPWDVIESKYPNIFEEKTQLLIIPIRLDSSLHINEDEPKISIQHNDISKKDTELIDILKKTFKNKFSWNGSVNKAIDIYF